VRVIYRKYCTYHGLAENGERERERGERERGKERERERKKETMSVNYTATIQHIIEGPNRVYTQQTQRFVLISLL
jgi:hypothetical protein